MRQRWLVLAVLGISAAVSAEVPSPRQVFGHEICEDYWLANYDQLTSYWSLLAKSSKRIQLVSIGKTEEGRDQWMAVISDPANLRNLKGIQATNRRIAMADFRDDAEALKTIDRAKSVVWIDGGLHANEVLGAQQLIETAYQLVSREDAENRRILRDNVILLVHANPDGMALVSDWYMRNPDPMSRSLSGLPRLYQKYAGHDNNRDFYAMNLAETRNMNAVLYEQWFPQIVYNHHQTAPAGTIMYIPPFRNPFNYHVDPIIQTGTDLVGLNMHQRLIRTGLGGTVMRDGASFSAWWNGGLRTTTYFHNMVGILTETWGSPNPAPLRFLADRQIPTTDLPMPINVRTWHLKDSLRYEVEANYAILDYASRSREKLLEANYRAAKNSIERGRKDHWTRYPARIRELGADALTKPALRDARAYLIRSDNPHWGASSRFVEKLLRTGIRVERVTTTHDGVPAGSYVVRCDQPFRPHILDMFEPQDHPNDFLYPGGPPKPPYDNAGYTLAYQMGVPFERLLEPPQLATTPIRTAKVPTPLPSGYSAGVTAPVTENESFSFANQALAQGLAVRRDPSGNFHISGEQAKLEAIAKNQPFGRLLPLAPGANDHARVKAPRIALWDTYGGSMTSGWCRWLLEEFQFPYTVLYGPDLNSQNLNDRYDVLVLPSDFRFAEQEVTGAAMERLRQDPTVPAEWRARIGSATSAQAGKRIQEFIDAGGHVVALGDAAWALAQDRKLPVQHHLVKDGKRLTNAEFFIPGSVLNVQIVPHPLTRGVDERLDLMFDNSAVFAPMVHPQVSALAEYDRAKPLRSGWAWGQEKLQGGMAMVDVSVGKGRAVLLAPEVNFRGQSHGAFKLLFNALFRATE
ncbi:MAG: M14 family metallopeptidase [Fimbriimonadaceae bacterium]|nr:M14 family metallopeptidase [Fimbriimonadaceae bacterium]